MTSIAARSGHCIRRPEGRAATDPGDRHPDVSQAACAPLAGLLRDRTWPDMAAGHQQSAQPTVRKRWSPPQKPALPGGTARPRGPGHGTSLGGTIVSGASPEDSTQMRTFGW